MTKEFKLTMAQLNASVGDFDGNLNKARDAYSIACKEGADMLAFPEMFLTGYQTQDLVQKSAFVEDAQSKLIEFAKEFWEFLKVRKKYWLLPIILVLVLFGGLIILSQGSAIAPFIYTIF